MDNEFRQQRAKTIRDMANKADPFVKKRLLDLAERYERSPGPKPPLSIIETESSREAVGGPQWKAVLKSGGEH